MEAGSISRPYDDPVPKAKAPPLPPWTDCTGCGWRSYREAVNTNPVRAVSWETASWVIPERCTNCGRELEHDDGEAA
jgi:hypothetical protein